MNIVFRVDSSTHLGSGHVMRCLVLAETLQNRGAKISFICCELKGNLSNFIEAKGYQVYRLPRKIGSDNCIEPSEQLELDWEEDAQLTSSIITNKDLLVDWLIVDHYSIAKDWEEKLSLIVKKIMVIDDLANREHYCHLLLDQNLYQNINERYKSLIPIECRCFLGAKYALLRTEFREAKKHQRQRNGNVERILIFYGGSDSTNETTKALESIRMIDRADIEIDVVVGASNPYKEEIEKLCTTMTKTNFCCQVENMAELINQADLALGAGGTSIWERSYLGLPSIITITAKNQAETSFCVSDQGVTMNLGWFSEVTVHHLVGALRQLLNNPEALIEMETKNLKLMENETENFEQIINAILGEV